MSPPIIIVGAGIAGASAAYHLSQRTEREILVLERGAIAAETTGKSTAVFRFFGKSTLDRMKRYGLQQYNEFLGSPEAMTEYEALAGRLEVASSEAAAATLKAENPPLGTYLAADAIHETVFVPELATDDIHGALYIPNAGYFRPTELTFEYVERAERAGVEFRESTTVEDIYVDDGQITGVETRNDSFETDTVVSAAGPWNLQIGRAAGIELPIRHTLAPALKLEPGNRPVQTLPNIKHADTGYYFRGKANGEFLAGHSPGDYDVATEYDPTAVSDSVPAEIREGVIDIVAELVPALIDSDIVEEWVGVRSRIPDERPMAGPVGPDGFHMMAFHSEGMQLAPAAGRAVADAITGDSVQDDLSPKRLREHPDADY